MTSPDDPTITAADVAAFCRGAASVPLKDWPRHPAAWSFGSFNMLALWSRPLPGRHALAALRAVIVAGLAEVLACRPAPQPVIEVERGPGPGDGPEESVPWRNFEPRHKRED